MPQQAEQRLLTGGINADATPDRVGKDQLLNSFNISSGLQNSALRSVSGNSACTAINDLLPSGTNTLIGLCIYNVTSYLFFFNPSAGCFIIAYNKESDSAFVLIKDVYVTGGLGWNADMFISCVANKDVLIFTEPTHDIRYLNISAAYTSAISQSQLSLITEPGVVPLTSVRVTLAEPSTIQVKPIQFGYRFINEDGFTSVLSPYSLTSLPTRQSDIQLDGDTGNAITVTMPYPQHIPDNWKQVDYIARIIDTASPNGEYFYVINSWYLSNPADAAEVAAHNAGFANLTLTNWTGATFDLLDTVYTSKQFDQLPLSAKAVAFGANRLLIGNAVEGYDTPVITPTITVAPHTFVADLPAYMTYSPYIIFVKQQALYTWYYAIILRIGSLNYLLPHESASGTFQYASNQLPIAPTASPVNLYLSTPLFDMPECISIASLIKLKETGDPNVSVHGDASVVGVTSAQGLARANIVAEANAALNANIIPDRDGGTLNMYLMPYRGQKTSVRVETASPAEFGPLLESRAFVSGLVYNLGIQYYDDAGRKPGIQNLEPIIIDDYNLTDHIFTDKITVTVPASTTAVPDYAKYFSITMSPGGALRFAQFTGGLVKGLLKDGAGNITFTDPINIAAGISGFGVYGIGVPIPNSFKYDFTAGDYMMYSCYDYTIGTSRGTGRAKIIGVYQNLIVLEYSDGNMYLIVDGYSTLLTVTYDNTATGYSATLTNTTSSQYKTVFTLVSGVLPQVNEFEIAAFGNIINGQFGNFFSTGNQSIDIYGDGYTQSRVGGSGGATLLSLTTNENTGIIRWINDLGRIAPIDTVGQKTLGSIVRWSNTAIPGASLNGLASFDAGDYKMVDVTSGDINALILTTRGIQEGGQLLILCERGSFVGLVDQQKLTTADGQNLTVTGEVLSSINPITGGWGCQHPRSIASYEGSVWWWDNLRREIIEFNASGAQAVSRHGMTSVFAIENGDVYTCVNTYTQEVMFSFRPIIYQQEILPTTNLVSPDFPLYPQGYTYCYQWVQNKWDMVYESGAYSFNIQETIFGYKNGSFWKEFTGSDSLYGNVPITSMIVVPYNEAYPTTLGVASVEVDCDVQPSQAWVIARDGNSPQVCQVNAWVRREGTWQGMVRRNRNKAGSTFDQWPLIGIAGDPLKSRCPILILIWSESVTIRSSALNVIPSSGHLR